MGASQSCLLLPKPPSVLFVDPSSKQRKRRDLDTSSLTRPTLSRNGVSSSRPEFQSLAGLRESLRLACPDASCAVRTLLLTATLTQDCHDTIRFLFGHDECQLVGELALRPEPGFLISRACVDVERDRRVLEAIRFLPNR